jgi:hypothetical protein
MNSPEMQTQPPHHLPQRLAMSLSTMQKLEKLTLQLPCRYTEEFHIAFEDNKVTLPSVKYLEITACDNWIIPICPDVRSVIATFDMTRCHDMHVGTVLPVLGDHLLNLTHAAGKAASLVHLEIFDRQRQWDDILPRITENIPNLQSLAQVRSPNYGGIYKLLPRLSVLQNLRVLALDNAEKLELGSRHRQLYFRGASTQERREEIEKDRPAMLKIARPYFATLKGLEVLWIGDYDKAVVERGENGGIKNIELGFGDRLKESLRSGIS